MKLGVQYLPNLTNIAFFIADFNYANIFHILSGCSSRNLSPLPRLKDVGEEVHNS